MKILAIDTSTEYLSLAVSDGEKTTARLRRKAPMSHSSLLVPMIDKVLKKARLKIGDIDCFAVSAGPGSFTGLRIGLATVKGLAFALKKKIVTVPTMDVIAENAKSFKGIICVVLDARKNKVYSCVYESDGRALRRRTKYLLITKEDLSKLLKKYKNENILYLGSMAGEFDTKYSKAWHPKAQAVARLGLERARKRRFVSPEDLEPMYLYSRECDIKGI